MSGTGPGRPDPAAAWPEDGGDGAPARRAATGDGRRRRRGSGGWRRRGTTAGGDGQRGVPGRRAVALRAERAALGPHGPAMARGGGRLIGHVALADWLRAAAAMRPARTDMSGGAQGERLGLGVGFIRKSRGRVCLYR